MMKMMMMIITTALMTTAPRVGQLPAWLMLWPNNIYITDGELRMTAMGASFVVYFVLLN